MSEDILLVFPSNIGDTIICLPVLDALRASYPDSKLTALASPKTKDFLARHSFIDAVEVFDKQWSGWQKLRFSLNLRGRYHTIVDLKNSLLPVILGAKKRTPFVRRNTRSRHVKDIYLSFLEGLVVNSPRARGELCLTPEEKDKWQKIPADSLFIAASSRSHLKRLDQADLKQALGELAGARPLVIIGEEVDRAYYGDILAQGGVVDLLGKTTIAEVFYLIKHYAQLLLSVDSSLLHIASYLNKPIVAVFGPTDPARYGPWSDNCLVLQGESGEGPIRLAPAKIIEALNSLWTNLNVSS